MSTPPTPSQDELRIEYERLLATLPAETQAQFRANEAAAKARPPRPQLDDLSLTSLNVLTGEELDHAVCEQVETVLGSAQDRAAALLSLPRGIQIFYISFVVEVEVMNGGLNQFFSNSSSELAELAAPALRDLQATEAADLFVDVLAVAKAARAEASTFNQIGTIEVFSASYEETNLTAFDNAFCRLAEQFPGLRAALLREHEELF